MMIGHNVGPYEVVAKLGEGGMGEVYRARDAKLHRDVALKVLPEAFAADADRLARFAREAQVLASLNHPNIAQIYGIEETAPLDAARGAVSDSRTALVMELVEGEDLSQILASHGHIPLSDAIPIARQIASALEGAHEQGIIHRDLKPANVKVRPDGTVKVLDFGLARWSPGSSDPGSKDPGLHGDSNNSPTLTARATQIGMILGTAAYMSPEQAKGRGVDKRADIWAFGAVLYEMLTGSRAFKGDNVSDTLASVLKDAPALDALPPGTPPRLKGLIERCLQRDVKLRLRDIGEARIALEDPGLLSTADAAPSASGTTAKRWTWMAIGAAAGAIVAALATVFWPRPVADVPAIRFSVPLPAPPPALSSGAHLAVSPDGRMIAVSLVDNTGRRLYIRKVGELEMVPIRGTELAVGPFFSPDSQWVAFFAEGKLKKVPVAGGSPETLCTTDGITGTWGANGEIVIQPAFRSALSRVPAGGGTLQPLTTLLSSEAGHAQPQWLPDGKTLLFTAFGPSATSIVALTAGSSERQTIVNGGVHGRYVESGYLTYLDERSDVLMAVPFSASSLRTTGQAVRIGEGVARVGSTGLVDYDASLSGTVVFIPGSAVNQASLAWVTRDGTTRMLPIKPQPFEQPRLSPNGQRLAARISGEQTDLWSYDLDRGTPIRLTFEPPESETALWSPDNSRVYYAATRAGKPRGIFSRPADGGTEILLASADHLVHLTSLSPNGRDIAFTQFPAATGDVMILRLGTSPSEAAVLKPLLQTQYHEHGAVFSRDGNWIAYVSNEAGSEQVFVQAYPGPGGKVQISSEGGAEPVWSKKGLELFYRNGDQMMAVPFTLTPTFKPGVPVELFKARFERAHRNDANYDVAADGRFLMIRADQQSAPRYANVLMNLPELRAGR